MFHKDFLSDNLTIFDKFYIQMIYYSYPGGKKHIGDNMKIKEETYGIAWGTVFLIIGVVILLTAFSFAWNIAQNPSDTLEKWVPSEVKGPTSAFQWFSDDKSVEFNDVSTVGDSDVSSWHWDFGDDSTSSNQNPKHDYSTIDNYIVILEVEDENGNTNTARTRVSLSEGESAEGTTQVSMSLDLGLTNTFDRFAIAIIISIVLAITVMIGGRFLIAGCRLLRPNIQLYKMKVRPKEIEKKVPPK